MPQGAWLATASPESLRQAACARTRRVLAALRHPATTSRNQRGCR